MATDHVLPVVPPGRMRDSAQPTLTSDNGLILRPFTSADAADVLRAYRDPDVRFWGYREMNEHAEAARWITERHEGWRDETGPGWAVTDGTVLLGSVALRNLRLDVGIAEVGYWVLPEARGRGAAVAALRTLRDWCFGELGLHRINLYHSVANPASCRVAEKAAFAWEGTARSSWPHPDGWHDMHLHGSVAGD